MKNKIIRIVISVILIFILGVIVFFGLIITGLSGNGEFYDPFILTLFFLLAIWLIVWALQLLKSKILLYIFIGIILCSTIAITIYHRHINYIKNIPTVDDQGVNLSDYQPFVEDTKIAKLYGSSNLSLRDSLPRIDGATALYPLYAAFVEATYPQAEYNPYMDEGVVVSNTTPVAYQRLISGKADIIFCAAPSKSQIEEAEVARKNFTMTPIGREAFVFFVNINNPVDNITVGQIQDIYSGKITNWHDVGGKDEEIKAFQRPTNSGSQTMLEKIMEDKPLMAPPQNDIVGGMGHIIERAAEYKNFENAIGYTFLFFATQMVGNKQIKLLKVNGVYPDKASIENNNYPFVGDFYAVTIGSQSENVNKFINWILSDQGQSLVEKTGYMPLNKTL